MLGASIRGLVGAGTVASFAACGSTQAGQPAASMAGQAGLSTAGGGVSAAGAGAAGVGAAATGGVGGAASATGGGGANTAGSGTPVAGAGGEGAAGEAGSAGAAGALASPFVDPYTGQSGCPSGGAAIGHGVCELSMPLSGGLSTFIKTPDDVGCRQVTTTDLSLVPISEQNETWFHFSKPIVRGEVGVPLAASVELRTKASRFDTPQVWSTAPGSCTITLASTVCWYFEVPQPYYLISGTGSCSAPAEPQADNPGTAVTISDFWFATLVYPD